MAAGIELIGLTKRFGNRSRSASEHTAVDAVDLSVAGGEFFSLLGPSGCGKTTTLRLIAGFEEPTAGRILLDGADVSHVAPHKRNVNTVFQSYALFPFLSVYDNVAFGLKHGSVGKAEAKQRVGDALALVGLSDFAGQPAQLSGGQQQRVALARALVLNPAVLLLDEPLGALDAKLRRSLKVELKALQERVGITFIYVTHDQEEALTMSDRLAVMNAGRIAQVGTPQEVYESPADAYVADFLGAANLLEIVVSDQKPGAASFVQLGDIVLSTSNECPAAPGARAQAVIRPERVRVEAHGSSGDNRVPALIDRVVYLGASSQVICRLATGEALQAVMPNEDVTGWPQGTPVHVHLPADALRVLAGSATPLPDDAEALAAGLARGMPRVDGGLPVSMTTLGLIGSGSIGSTVARLAVAAGHSVVLSNSRGPETLQSLAAELGPQARAATGAEAAEESGLVLVSIPVKACPVLPDGVTAALAGKVVLDTGNYYPERDGQIAELAAGSLTTAEWVARLLPGAQVVKAFNNIFFKHLLSLTRPGDAPDRTYLPIAGDEEALAHATAFLSSIGYGAVGYGTLADSWRQEPGTPVYGAPYGSFEDEKGTPASEAVVNEALAAAKR